MTFCASEASGSVEVSWCDYAYCLFRLLALERSRFRKIAFLFFRLANPLVSLMGRREPCSARIAADRETDGHTQTHRPSTVTLVAHACRGLMKSANHQCITHVRAMNIVVSTLVESLTLASYSSRFHACFNTVEPLLTTTSDKRPLLL